MTMTELTIGRKAPAFTAKDTDGKSVSLNKDIVGKPAVIYFYPKDDTPGCTKEACSIRDHWAELKRRRIQVYGISPDDAESHAKFRDKFKLPFPLLCDPGHKIAEKYGAWGEKNMYGKKTFGIKRSTFLLDKEGRIQHIWKRPDVKRHAEQILEKLDEFKAKK
jgi:peroxiredoxin Q/BCP